MAKKVEKKDEHKDAPLVCPACGSTDIIFDSDRGEYVCNSCGLVIEEDVVDQGAEWRAFDADQRNERARTGAPMK